MELQHLVNTLKNLQRAKQDVEDNLNRSLREKDSIIHQLQLSLEGKTKDMEVSWSNICFSLYPGIRAFKQLSSQLSSFSLVCESGCIVSKSVALCRRWLRKC